MANLVSKPAPDFTADAVMPDGSFKQIKLSDYRGKNVILFFYPLDFTFVCPTEIIAFSNKNSDFEKRNTVVLGVSIDSKFSHLAWRNTDRKQGGLGEISYPLIGDLSKQICKDYDVLADFGVAFRGLFLIDKDGVIQHQVINNLPLGRNIDEALRMVDALKFHEDNGEVCPANWKEGEDGMKADPNGSQEYFSKHN